MCSVYASLSPYGDGKHVYLSMCMCSVYASLSPYGDGKHVYLSVCMCIMSNMYICVYQSTTPLNKSDERMHYISQLKYIYGEKGNKIGKRETG